MVRRIYRVTITALLLHAGAVFADSDNPPRASWYLGGSAAYTQPYFFGLINDISATAPASLALGLVAGREAPLLGAHSLGWEFALSRTLGTDAEQANFAPTFSKQYPAGATIRYRNIAQTLSLFSLTYGFALNDWLTLAGKIGLGARHLHAAITLDAPDGTSYNAASPSGVMAIVSAALGFEIRSRHFGWVGLYYQSVPSVVYPVSVGTATVRSADMLVVQWRFVLTAM